MRNPSIYPYEVTVTLTADDCALLARVCNDWPECGREHTAEIAHVETMGAVFQTLGIAANLLLDMPPDQARKLLHSTTPPPEQAA